jgi:DNA-binding XRE family transcriptional regulator
MTSLPRLRTLRLRAAMTQVELANQAGLGRQTIVRLEAGDPNASPPTVKRLARALRVKPFELWEDQR